MASKSILKPHNPGVETAHETSSTTKIPVWSAWLAIAAAVLVLALLFSLHFLSPEFDPAWRLLSEYANGSYGWVLSLLFLSWGISSWALAYTLRGQVHTTGGKIGLGFLVAAGAGEIAAAFFDINSPLHSPFSMLGILALPIAAMLVSLSLSRAPDWSHAKRTMLLTANLTWLVLVLMLATFALMIVTFVQSGAPMTDQPTTVPDGVIALVGYPNRLLIVLYNLWVITMAWLALRVNGNAK